MVTKEELGEELCDHCSFTEYGLIPVNTNQYNLCEGSCCDEAYMEYLDNNQHQIGTNMDHKKVIFNKPATIVIWEDDTKTIVKCNKNDKFKKTTGFLIAYLQKTSGMTKSETAKFLKVVKSNQ